MNIFSSEFLLTPMEMLHIYVLFRCSPPLMMLLFLLLSTKMVYSLYCPIAVFYLILGSTQKPSRLTLYFCLHPHMSVVVNRGFANGSLCPASYNVQVSSLFKSLIWRLSIVTSCNRTKALHMYV